MIGFLIACAPFIPTFLSLAGLLMKLFGTSEKDIRAYEDMIMKMNAAGRLSLESHDRLTAHKDAILKRQEEKKKQPPSGS